LLKQLPSRSLSSTITINNIISSSSSTYTTLLIDTLLTTPINLNK